MDRTAHLRSLVVLHPTFETWGGAEWTIHGQLEALRTRFDVDATLITDRYVSSSGPPASYRVVEHHCGGELSARREWNAITERIRGELAQKQLVVAHNYPATQWIAPDLHTPTVWYCHEPPRRLYGPHSDAVELEPTLPLSPRGAVASVVRHGKHAVPRAWSRLRMLLERDGGSQEAPLELDREEDRRAVGRIGSVVANSRHTAGRVREIYGIEAEVIPPVPADLDDSLLETSDAKERLVVWAGRMTPLKRPVEMVRGWVGWQGRHDPAGEWRLTLLGHGPLAERVRAEAKKGLPSTVEVIDALPRGDLARLFRRARLVVHTAREEPFGLVPLEAAACGTAVLAHAEGGVLDTVRDGETGWLCELGDVPRLEAALERALSDVSELDRRGAGARDRVRESWSFGGAIETFHRHLVKCAASPSRRDR